VIPQAVELNTACIIYVKVFLLCNCIHLLVVEELNIPDKLLGLEFTD
jgi:hypothetical protein